MNKKKIKILEEFIIEREFNNVQCAKELKVTEGAIRFWRKGLREIPASIIELIYLKGGKNVI